jgi:hypothetical protein
MFAALCDELIEACLTLVGSAVDLATAAAVCSRWRLLVLQVAQQLLEMRVLRKFPAEDFNVLLQLASAERLEAALGVRPTQRRWQDEWTDLMVAEMREAHRLHRFDTPAWDEAQDEPAYRSAFTPESLLKRLEEERDGIALAKRCKLPVGHAEAFLVLGHNCGEMLFAPVPDLAASSYAYYDALSAIARLGSASALAPPVYSNLYGQYGLEELDESWRNLFSGALAVGRRFVTRRAHTFVSANAAMFPDGKTDGVYQEDIYTGESTLCSHDVVCIRSMPNDGGGRHNPIREAGVKHARYDGACFALPPFTVVDVLSVQNTWRVRRQAMSCRLFTCAVTFDLR